jgi:hypothetical protein
MVVCCFGSSPECITGDFLSGSLCALMAGARQICQAPEWHPDAHFALKQIFSTFSSATLLCVGYDRCRVLQMSSVTVGAEMFPTFFDMFPT